VLHRAIRQLLKYFRILTRRDLHRPGIIAYYKDVVASVQVFDFDSSYKGALVLRLSRVFFCTAMAANKLSKKT
jgi:hypothetical protein